jgi:HSP20 family molecular chaperone IbpA
VYPPVYLSHREVHGEAGIHYGIFFMPVRGNTMVKPKKEQKDKKIVIVPPTGISENGRSICIISQLHGIPEEDIRIDLEKTQLIISALLRTETVMRKITVPAGSRISRKKFRDGILEIILERPL